MVKVVLADNHVHVRNAILRVLATDPRIEVLGDAANFFEAIAQAQKFRPDVLIVDLRMPLEGGFSSSDLNRELNLCGAKILAISFATDEDAQSIAQSMGALELLDKMNLGKELIPAILRLASVDNLLPTTLPAEASHARELQ